MTLVPDLPSSRAVVQKQLPSLRRLENRLASYGRPEELSIILALDESKAYYVGRELDRFDRELRRTAASARRGQVPLAESLAESIAMRGREDLRVAAAPGNRGGRALEERPKELRGSLHGTYPDHPGRSSLRLVASEPGSALLLLEAFGDVVDVLTSDPVTAIANAAAWSGAVRWVRAWIRRTDDPLTGISARQALEVLREHGADPSQVMGTPDEEVDLGTAPEVRLPDGTSVTGSRRIHLVQRNADGSTTWIEVE